jgi:homocysteine S-methyltransferase
MPITAKTWPRGHRTRPFSASATVVFTSAPHSVHSSSMVSSLRLPIMVSTSSRFNFAPPSVGRKIGTRASAVLPDEPMIPELAPPGKAVVLLDGPMGTELVRRGVSLPALAWSAAALDMAPDVVATIHGEYVKAGATVHTANTFRTKRRAVGQRWDELARRAVRIARARAASGRVAGSIAPLEDCYMPHRSPGRSSRAEHRELVRVLADEQVDLLLCETFAASQEAAIAVEEASLTGVETWVALTAGPDGSLLTPLAMREAARSCVSAGARAVLVNCTPASQTLRFVEAVSGLGVPYGAYANAGDRAEGMGWGAETGTASAVYAEFARSWVQNGATIVGGCCGTGPLHVSELARIFNEHS